MPFKTIHVEKFETHSSVAISYWTVPGFPIVADTVEEAIMDAERMWADATQAQKKKIILAQEDI